MWLTGENSFVRVGSESKFIGLVCNDFVEFVDKHRMCNIELL